MGQEILYCFKCRIQLRSADFDKKKAYRINGTVSCFGCARELVRSLPPETVKQLIDQITSQEDAAEKKKSNTSRILRAADLTSRPQSWRAPRRMGPRTRGIAGGLIVALILGVAVALATLPSTSSRPRVTARDRSPEESSHVPQADRHGGAPAPPVSDPPISEKKSLTGTFEIEASESLQRAREFAKRKPEDLMGQIALYEKAVWDSSGTAVLDPARRELDDLKKKDRELALKELPPLLDLVHATAGREEFGRALLALERNRNHHAGNEWTGPVEKAAEDIRGQAASLYASLSQAAVAAARRQAPDEVRSIRDRILRWGLADWQSDLERQLGQIAVPATPPAAKDPPPPSVSPAMARSRKAWATAMDLARARDYDSACRELEKVAPEMTEPSLRTEMEADADLLRLAAGLFKESIQALAAWPKNQKLSLRYWDERGSPVSIEATSSRVNGSRVEGRAGKDPFVVELGELTADTLAELHRNRPSRKPASDGRPLGIFYLLEGDPSSARTAFGEASSPIPNKYWQWAQEEGQMPKASELAGREGAARKAFYAAEKDYAVSGARADAVLRFRALQKEFGNTLFGRRNAASIAQRCESPKEYLLAPEDLGAAGTFRISEGKTGIWWTSDMDSSPALRKHNFIEASFSVLPETSYRCWVYVGGCCAETTTFYVQGTEMKWAGPENASAGAVEPGDDAMVPVKHALIISPRTHASHGGKKQPARWGWVEIPLPKYSTAGRKTVRFLSDQQGFSVEYAVVTSVRQFPPTETEWKDLKNSRGPAQIGPLDSKLIGYWTFDEGKGTSAGDSSPNRNGATLTPGVGWTEGRMGMAVTLTSATTCVRIGSAPALSDVGPLTVMAWIRPTRLSLGRVVAKEDGGRGRWMFIAGEKGIDFAKDFADQELRRETIANLLSVGTWSHVSATWDGSTQAAQVHIYVNGAEATYSISQDGRGARMSDAAMPLLIGNRGDLTRGFEGAIDDVRIYNRVLTPADIMTIAGLRSK